MPQDELLAVLEWAAVRAYNQLSVMESMRSKEQCGPEDVRKAGDWWKTCQRVLDKHRNEHVRCFRAGCTICGGFDRPEPRILTPRNEPWPATPRSLES